VFIGETIIEASPAELKDLLFSFDKGAPWDPLLKKGEMVEVLDSHTYVIHLSFEARVCLLKAQTDVVLLGQWFTVGDTVYMVGRSINHPSCPETPPTRRLIVFESGYKLTPNGDGTTSAVYVSHPDMRQFPTALAEMVAVKQPMLLYGLRQTILANKNLKKEPTKIL